MKNSVLIAILLLAGVLQSSSMANAEEHVVSVPGEGWKIRFDAPKMEPTEGLEKSIFNGHAKTENIVISLFVEPPQCGGDDSNENIYNCFASRLKKSPVVIWDTERGNTVPNGVMVEYLGQLPQKKVVTTSFHVHLLFARKGKWADFHASVWSLTEPDIRQLLDIIASVKIEDE